MSAARWPGVTVAPEVFAAYVEERADEADAEHHADLYLACACANGSAAAIAAFETTFVSTLDATLGKLGDDAFIAEAKQRLRDKLFVAEAGHAAKITEYRGRGPLGAWVRVVAARVGLNLKRRPLHDQPQLESGAHLALPALEDDPELQLIKTHYAPQFRQAFSDAVASLDATERTLLRLHFVDGLNIDQLGRLHGIHRATAARRVAAARDALFDRVRDLLRERLGLSPTEFHSLVGAIRSQLDLSLHQLL
jgi:RNA polymerase sigma-70 factor (ECF subfamily)